MSALFVELTIPLGGVMINYNRLKGLSVILTAFMFVVLFQNCSGPISNKSDSFSQSPNGLSDGLDTGIVNHKPIIKCEFSDSNSSAFHLVSSISGENTFSTKKFNENSSISVDCGQTKDEQSADDLKFEIAVDYNSNSPRFISQSSSSFKLPALPPGIHNMALKVKDPSGEVAIKEFSLVVECKDNTPAPSLTNPSANIQVVEGSDVGLYNFSVSGVSGGNGFFYAWDFNGDDVFDPHSPGRKGEGSFDIWTDQLGLNDIYVNMTTRSRDRNVRLKIRNSCFKETIFNVKKSFTSTHPIKASDNATVLPYHYLQGDVSPNDQFGQLNAQQIKRNTGDYLATTNNVGDYTDFRCQLNKAKNGLSSLRIDTAKKYRNAQDAVGGMSLTIVEINDNGGDQLQSFSAGSGQSIDTAKFLVSAASDGMVQETFSTNGNGCQVAMRMKRAFGAVPCADGTGKPSEVIQYMGEWSCPNLTLEGKAARSVRVENGKFFCEQAIGDQCYGGGGGGGVPPIEF